MSKEIPQRPELVFGFTEHEELFYRLSHERFLSLFLDPATSIHRIEVSYNNYGEYLFVTVSRDTEQGREPMTFYGQGYHDQRERWITQEWFWYRANAFPSIIARVIDKAEAHSILNQRMEEIAPYIQAHQQMMRGRLFEMLADLTDEDGASAEMEDIPGWLIDDLE